MAQIKLKINDRTVATRTVDLTDKSEAVVEFQTTFAQRGLYQGVVEVADATYLPDNLSFFTVNVLPPVKILCVNGEAASNRFEDESYWFRLAMGKRNESPFQVDVVRPQQINIAKLGEYQVVALLNVNRLDQARTAAISKFVRAGGSVLLAPGDQVEARTFNSQFAELSPATLDRPVPDTGDDFLVLADIHFRHPALGVG